MSTPIIYQPTTRLDEIKISGVGEVVREKIQLLGLYTLQDAILHLPIRYEDQTRCWKIHELQIGVHAQVIGEVISAEVSLRPRKQLIARIADDQGDELSLRFLHFYASHQKLLKIGQKIRVLGEVRQGFSGIEIVHPQLYLVGETLELPQQLTPIYASVSGLTQTTLNKLVNLALSLSWEDTLPSEICQRFHLLPFDAAIRWLHGPPPGTQLRQNQLLHYPAWQRIKFDELLAQQLSLKRARQEKRKFSAPMLTPNRLLEQFISQLPFALTSAQTRVWHEILEDLNLSYPMARLLQGDVGSGKTIIAALACVCALGNGYQAAVMAPTEILAQQHLQKFLIWLTPLLAPLNIEMLVLLGSQTKKQKQAIIEKLSQPIPCLVIGTHALIQEHVQFAKLGLAVIDEQHRFGVLQRMALRSNQRESSNQRAETTNISTITPHQLMMSATPIPRTLAMTYYADLAVSIIDELPPGRKPIQTKLIQHDRRDEVIARIAYAIQTGQQVYWVCPLIEESETLQLQTAIASHEYLSSQLPQYRIGLIHGKLKSQEKQSIMQDFLDKKIDVLVATVVIEVGVDVPNANLIIIEHAERFGLAQLHQLRGRVGRGGADSVCVLLYQMPLSLTAKARLQTMFETTDGFEVAQRDLQIRGPGEFLGARQAGCAMLRFANLEEDQHLLAQVSLLADELLALHPDIVQRHLQRWMLYREEFLTV